MSTYEIIMKLCEEHGIAATALETKLGFGRGSIGKLKNGSTSVKRLQKIADYFGVTLEYLTTGSNASSEGTVTLTSKDKKDISSILADTEELLKQDGLMFDGNPVSSEEIESIISAMKIGMEIAKQKNKAKYTPNKYKKD